MSEIKSGYLYTQQDEWILVDGDTATIGITDHAQDALSDIVYIELPSEGDEFSKDDVFGIVESVKAAADLYMPIDGTIIAFNEPLLGEPELVNTNPYDKAWMVKITISDTSQLGDLMDAEAYEKFCEERDQ